MNNRKNNVKQYRCTRIGLAVMVFLLFMGGTRAAWADVIRLKSGKTVEGTILFQNEEVVVIRDANGSRYQYPKSDILEENDVQDDTVDTPSQSQEATQDMEQKLAAETGRKVSMGVSVFGGGMVLPAGSAVVGDADGSRTQGGGHAGAEVMVGTSNLLGHRIFLGGSVGFQSYMMKGKNMAFIPVKVRVEVPLMRGNHVPMLGLGAGYGIGLRSVTGGFCADVEFGWRYNFSRKGAFFLGGFADLQGCKTSITETVEGKDYTAQAHRYLCGFGTKIALFF